MYKATESLIPKTNIDTVGSIDRLGKVVKYFVLEPTEVSSEEFTPVVSSQVLFQRLSYRKRIQFSKIWYFVKE